MVYNKKDFIEHTNQIIPGGFERMLKNENIFVRKWNDRMERMDYTGREYFPHGAYFQGVIVSISFYSIENILNSVLNKYNIQQRYGNDTIHYVLNDIEGVDYSKFNIEIHDDESFQVVAKEIKKIVEYGAMPFFEKYNTLEKVLVNMEKMEGQEMANFIVQPLPIRRMIIKKICKDKDYEQYAMSIINYCKNKDITKSPTALLVEKVYDELRRY